MASSYDERTPVPVTTPKLFLGGLSQRWDQQELQEYNEHPDR